MLNKIKDKILHVLRYYCGYYELMQAYDMLSEKYEAKTLEHDILDNKIKEFPNLYKKYLVAELEEILNIMKEKGIHPQDLIVRIINKANRDIA